MIKLLLVEDNAVFRRTLREALHAHYPLLEILEAVDIVEARSLVRTGPPDLALLDISLPDGSGLDLAATLLLDWPQLPVAICTSHDLPEYRDVARRLGVRSFLVKQDLDWRAFRQFIGDSGTGH